MDANKALRLLGLSDKEEKVFLALQKSPATILDLSKATQVSRPSVYDIVVKLKKRGLVISRINSGKKQWEVVSQDTLSNTLYELKKSLLQFSDGKEEIGGVTDGIVTVYRGDEAVKSAVHRLFKDRKGGRILGYAGQSNYGENWSILFTQDEVKALNTKIKKDGLIIDAILPEGYAQDNFKKLGKGWALGYEGRSASTVYADKKYFQNAGELYSFKDSLFLVALKDKIIIEIQHSDIQKMILAFYSFMKSHSHTVDINKQLRELIQREENEKLSL